MNRRKLIGAGILMGVGMGGFLDGIIFHQILQTHSMLSAKLPQDNLVNVKTSMVWDGLFHLFTWITTAVSIKILWDVMINRNARLDGITLFGSIILGWGMFNLVEGIIDHHIFEIHHVIERLGASIYDYFFLGSGILFIITGMIIISSRKKYYREVHAG